MQQRLRRLTCRIFGCVEFEEVYAKKFIINGKPRYNVYRTIICSRCGKNRTEIIQHYKSRAEILKSEWFITK